MTKDENIQIYVLPMGETIYCIYILCMVQKISNTTVDNLSFVIRQLNIKFFGTISNFLKVYMTLKEKNDEEYAFFFLSCSDKMFISLVIQLSQQRKWLLLW